MSSRWLPIPEAAESLGVSIVTLKRHIKAGKVAARKEAMAKGWRWLIEVSEEDAPKTSHDEGWQALIMHLESQVGWYKQELETRSREVAELHVLLQRSQQTPHLLPPVQEYQPEAAPDRSSGPSSDAAHNSPNQSRKGFWRRLFGTT